MTPRLQQDRLAALKASTELQARTRAENNGGKTGAPPGMLQDDNRKLSRWLANQPHARQHVLEVCAVIAKTQGAKND